MSSIHYLIDVFLHLDSHLNHLAVLLGSWLYGLLFLVIFCETGLVVTPFLPGDSLLFAVGALAAMDGSPLSLLGLLILLIFAAVLGNTVNYAIGYRIGPRIFSSEDSAWLNKRHLFQAQEFYNKYGGKTIILTRFIPIVRTFAPFVAGVGKMTYRKFTTFNVIGGVSWVAAFLLSGFYFGNLPGVKRNFHFVIVAIIVISVAPAAFEYFRARRKLYSGQ